MLSTRYGLWGFQRYSEKNRDKAFNIAKNPKYDGYQRGLASMVYKCFYKKFASLTDKSVSGSGINVPLELRKDLRKPVIKKFILDLKMIFGELI